MGLQQLAPIALPQKKKKSGVSCKMEFTKGKIQRIKGFPPKIIKSEVQIITTQGELQHWVYYLRLVASAFCETVLLCKQKRLALNEQQQVVAVFITNSRTYDDTIHYFQLRAQLAFLKCENASKSSCSKESNAQGPKI